MAGASGSFKAVAEKFRVSLLSDSSNATERVQCEIGLEGVKILSDSGSRTLRIYPLNHISRWALRETQLLLYTKTPVDVEERTVTLQSDRDTCRSMLDVLTCSCMQMCELLQNDEQSSSNNKEAEENSKWAANILSGGSAKGREAPDSVQFWHHADKEGWLQSQGDTLKTWRRRWHVLKDGYIFRFMEADVNSTSKPRGITDIADVTEVSDAKSSTGKNNALKVVTPKGNVNYIADSETEQVEWISAIEAAICKIHDDKDPEPRPAPKQPKEKSSGGSKSSGGTTASLMRALEHGYNSAGGNSSGRSEVKVVGYDGPSSNSNRPSDMSYGGFKNYPSIAPAPAAPSGSYGASAPPPTEDFSALSLGYGIAGASSYSGGGGGSQRGYSSSNGGGYGGGGSGDPNYGGGYVSTEDPNYGVGHQQQQQPYGSVPQQQQQQQQPAAATGYGYDVFSQGPDHPASNYPSMQATVTDYTSQDYSSPRHPQAQQPPAAADYWSQQQQPQQHQGGYDYSAPAQQQQPYGGWDSQQSSYQQQQQYDYSAAPQQQQQPAYGSSDPYSSSGQQQQQQPYGSSADPYGGSAPQQQPAYSAPPAPAQDTSSWQACYTPEGQQYWHNTATGLTQWETPPGVAA